MADLKSFDRVADVYDETRALPAAAEASIVAAILDVLNAGGSSPRVIEIGIGTGRIAVPLAERGIRMEGIDVSPRMLARLRQKRRDVGVLLAEASALPIRGRPFDAALFVHVLHLVPDVAESVRQAVAALRPGGVVITGRDSAETGVREEADRAIRSVAMEVAGVHMTGWRPYDESDAIAAQVFAVAGATLRTEKVADWTARTSARRHLLRLARRDFSSAWDIPDEKLAEVVLRATPLLERIYGSADDEREYHRSFSLSVARLPA